MRRLVLASFIAASLVTTSAAFADVISPDVSACQGKDVGSACTTRGAPGSTDGACAKSTCSRIDYGSWNRDASSAPPTMEYECVRCVGGAAPTASGGCSMVARRAGPWVLAAVPAVVLAFIERRRSRR
jgi:hypothetical protein